MQTALSRLGCHIDTFRILNELLILLSVKTEIYHLILKFTLTYFVFTVLYGCVCFCICVHRGM